MTGDLHTSHIWLAAVPGSFFLITEGISLCLLTCSCVRNKRGALPVSSVQKLCLMSRKIHRFNLTNLVNKLQNACLMCFRVKTVKPSAYLPSTPSPLHPPNPPSTPPWPLRSLAFLLSHLIQFIIVGPPPYTQLSGETKALPNMDAFLFPWICAALPWGYCTPSSPPSLPAQTYTHTLHLLPGFQRGKKYLGLFIVSPLPWVEMPFRKDGTECSHSRGHILLRVMLIECKNVAELKGKRRSKGTY